ncbi:MAG: archaetidylserine decarboxylase [Oceanococcaceae bacterium]
MAAWSDRAFVALQRVLPTLLLTGMAHRLASYENPRVAQFLIRQAMQAFNISLDDADISDPQAYASFNAFFTRALNAQARPLAPAPDLLSPVDGTVSQIGAIRDGRIVQAKGLRYDVAELLDSTDHAAAYVDGDFLTIYLAPSNYHRIHMPLDARLTAARYVPGRLLSVNPATVRTARRVFSANERLVCHFHGDTDTPACALVLVGALFVSGLETVATGVVTPPHGGRPRDWSFAPPVALARGAELGRFNYGSTVILLLPRGWIWNDAVEPGSTVRMGESLARPPSLTEPARRTS